MNRNYKISMTTPNAPVKWIFKPILILLAWFLIAYKTAILHSVMYMDYVRELGKK